MIPKNYFPHTEYTTDWLNIGSSNPVIISFDKEKHEYWVRDISAAGMEIQQPSVSYILEQVFGNRFKRVKQEVLERARKKGTAIHEEICQWTIGKGAGVSDEWVAASTKILDEMYRQSDYIACEQILFCNNQYARYCCTIDAFWIQRGRCVDYKTGKKLDYEHVVRQLNLYAYALKKNGYCVNWMEAWHLNGTKLTVCPIEYSGDFYCECILRAYSEGRTFKNDKEMLDFYREWKVEEKAPVDVYCERLKEVDAMIDKLSATKDKLVNNIKEYMETTKRQDYVRDDIGMTVKLIPESERTSIDTKLIKEQAPVLYERILQDYPKASKVSAHIRVSYKKES